MSKVVKSVTKPIAGLLGGGFEQPKAQKAPSRTSGMTPEEMAERRAAAAASGRKIEEEDDLGVQREEKSPWLKGGGSVSDFWT